MPQIEQLPTYELLGKMEEYASLLIQFCTASQQQLLLRTVFILPILHMTLGNGNACNITDLLFGESIGDFARFPLQRVVMGLWMCCLWLSKYDKSVEKQTLVLLHDTWGVTLIVLEAPCSLNGHGCHIVAQQWVTLVF